MNRPDEGGGSSAISAITVSLLAAMVTDLEAQSKTLQSHSSLKRRLGEYGIGMTEFQHIVDVGKWIDAELPMLRRRLTLAKALEQQAGPGKPVSLTEPVRLPTEAELTKMRDLAKKIKDHGRIDEEGAKLYHDAALRLSAAGNDPDLLSAFFAELGPKYTPMMASTMAASGSKTAAEDLKLFSKAFGTASKDTDPPQGLTDIMNAFKVPPLDDGRLVTAAAWGRLALLQEGDFDPKWLTDVVRANGLDTFASKDRDRTDFRGGNTQATGLPEDVIALAFGALKNNPEASRAAINSMGPMSDTVKLVYGYAKSFGTGDTVADNFGLAIEAGTGSTTEEAGQHSPDASKFAYEFILASGQYKEVPWPIKDSLARVAGSYSHEMLTGGRTDDGRVRESGMGKPGEPGAFEDIPGVTPAFYLNPEDTYRFLHGFAESDILSDPFDEAMGNLQNSVTQLAAQRDRDAIKAGQPDPRNYERSMRAFGSLAGIQYQSMKDVRGSMDEFDKKVRENMSKIVTLGIGKVPTPTGFAAKWAWKRFTKAAGAGLKQFVKGGTTRVQLLQSQDLQETLAMSYRSAAILVNAGYPHHEIPPEIRGANGKLLSIDEITKDDAKLSKFYAWSDSNNQPPYNMDGKIENGEAGYIGGAKLGDTYGSTLKWN